MSDKTAKKSNRTIPDPEHPQIEKRSTLNDKEMKALAFFQSKSKTGIASRSQLEDWFAEFRHLPAFNPKTGTGGSYSPAFITKNLEFKVPAEDGGILRGYYSLVALKGKAATAAALVKFHALREKEAPKKAAPAAKAKPVQKKAANAKKAAPKKAAPAAAPQPAATTEASA